jgi:transposase
LTFRPLTNSQESVSICVALAISHNDKSNLCIIPKNYRPQELVDILENELLPSIDWDPFQRRCRAFLLDNNGRHRSTAVKITFGLHRLDRLGYLPPNSPDLNPIENLWHEMKDFVRDIIQQMNLSFFKQFKVHNEAIDPKTLRNLFESMPRRMQAVIDANGDRINY